MCFNSLIKISFKFKSFHSYNLNNSLKKIFKKINQLSLKTSGIVSFPTKIQRFTVLRSPHIDKKSREQFEIRTYNKLINIFINKDDFKDKQKLKLIISFIKNSTTGIGLKITYKI